ncbi:glycoside hydrolase family 13 protein [Immersiella caudata]|uniref:alpha-amylase n=1 Tax=Immersiella caudata TaxID=314043 RepID=A0AA40CDM2_9PEZI|nr:glycoside hydrolase family 13 protein [Immersiella caudata]
MASPTIRIFTLLTLLTPSLALSASQWRAQSIYQVLTDRFGLPNNSTTAPCNAAAQRYCGGTYSGIINNLDYIQHMGFTAVWISPFNQQIFTNSSNTDGDSYHGYWASDIHSLNPRFGTEADLIALSDELHRRGMYLMADAVPNHMAFEGCRACVDYSTLKPWNRAEWYHEGCGIRYEDQRSVEVCWQGGDRVSLPDLKTEREEVRAVWNQWVADVVRKYKIDGLRIDSAKHIEPSFWDGFNKAAGVYILGEVYSGDPNYVIPYQRYMDGLLDYPGYYWIMRAFRSSSGSIAELVSGLNTIKNSALDTSLFGSFLENHDVERFAYFTKDVARTKNAIAFIMLKDGIPIVYQGQEQGYSGAGIPHNREALWLSGYSTSSELYGWIARLNRIRRWVITQDDRYLTYRAFPIYSDSNTIVMKKGHTGDQIISVYTNLGSSSTTSLALSSSATGFTPGQVVMDVVSCTPFTANPDGSLTVALVQGVPRVLYPAAHLTGSGICPDLETGTPIPTPSSTLTPSLISSSAPATTQSQTPVCTSPVQVEFQVLASTAWGESIKLVGNTTALGSWTPSLALPLSPSRYTAANPIWWASVPLTPGTAVAYKFIKVGSSGQVAWQGGGDRVYAVGCERGVVGGSW